MVLFIYIFVSLNVVFMCNFMSFNWLVNWNDIFSCYYVMCEVVNSMEMKYFGELLFFAVMCSGFKIYYVLVIFFYNLEYIMFY